MVNQTEYTAVFVPGEYLGARTTESQSMKAHHEYVTVAA
jgi:hypothetical protein